MEYADTINSASFAAAVSLTRRLRADRSEPLVKLAAEAVTHTFCVCVTDGEDAAEHRFSAIHQQLIDEVVARVQASDAAPSKDVRDDQ